LGAILRFELKASHLLSRWSTIWAMHPSLFLFSYFSGRILAFCRLQPAILLPTASRVGGDACHHVQLIDWDGILLTFFKDWLWTVILLISASLVTRITDISHHAWPFNFLKQVSVVYIYFIWIIISIKISISSCVSGEELDKVFWISLWRINVQEQLEEFWKTKMLKKNIAFQMWKFTIKSMKWK
jgi:hypothetical protein